MHQQRIFNGHASTGNLHIQFDFAKVNIQGSHVISVI